MIYKNFRLNIIVRILLLTASIFIFLFILMNKIYYIIPIFFVLLIVFQVIHLIYYVDRTNREVTNFLESIRFSDFSRNFQSNNLGASFDELKKAFNEITLDFQKIRTEKQEHYFYLQNIIQHIEIGIVAFTPDGTVQMINQAAKKTFQTQTLKNIKLLASWYIGFDEVLMSMQTGDNRLIKLKVDDSSLQLALHASEFKIKDQEITLVSIKNIQSEMDEQEMEAWQKLIKVLTHEIMNSIAPISSLTSTVNLMVSDVAESIEEYVPDDFDRETLMDIKEALTTIYKRSTGLIHFVEKYRNLTKIPKPNFTIYKIKDQFKYLSSLLAEELQHSNIELKIDIMPENIEITADEQLIEQVLINMVKNSIHGLENTENKKLQLSASINQQGKCLIEVIDNGQGIISEVLDKIFIPFFTTKSTGSGIGLALSKQIMRLHGGSIYVHSEPDVETRFTLSF